MKKRATAAAPMPVFFAYQYDLFMQKYVKVLGEVHPIFTGELYLNTPIKDSIRNNGANAKFVLAHRYGRIISGLIALSYNTYVGNIAEYDSLNPLQKQSVFYVRLIQFENGENLLFVYLYPKKKPYKNPIKTKVFAVSQLAVFNDLAKQVLTTKTGAND